MGDQVSKKCTALNLSFLSLSGLIQLALCVEAMAQPQPSVPEYPRPNGVPEDRRNAATPPPGNDESPDAVLALDGLVSDNLMPVQEPDEAASHGYTCTVPGEEFPQTIQALGCEDSNHTDVFFFDSRLATICSIVQLGHNSI